MNNIGKNIKIEMDKQFSNELGKALNSGSENISDFIQNAQSFRNAITSEDIEEDMIAKNKFKKGDFIKNLSKGKSMGKPIGKLFSMGKSENKEATAAGSAGGMEVPLFGKGEMKEKWSQKYKDSINCDNPKGFSQRAHCNGKKKLNESQKLKGGKSDNITLVDIFEKHSKKHKSLTLDILKKQLNKGINVEMEHTDDRKKAKEIAMDHISENPKYYDKLDKVEKGEFKEATSSASSGSYETPAAWAKSTSKKDWRGKSKTLFPGGKFVTVKKKCKKFPYCNQGDINALKLTNEEILQKTISDLSKKYNISEQMIKKMIMNDYYNIK